jgi:hypothetical protein
MALGHSTISRLSHFRRSPLRLRWLVVLSLLVVVGLGVGVTVLARRESRTETYYVCYANGVVSNVGRAVPESCPEGGVVIRGVAQVDGPVASLSRRATALLHDYLTIPDVMIALSVAILAWIIAGWRIHETRLLLAWASVPVGAVVAATCVAGPGHWFSKQPYEGPSIIPLGPDDAVTALDLVGIAIAVLTLLLAIWLVMYRVRQPRPA